MLAKDSSIFSSSGSRTRRRRRDSTLDRVLGVYGGRECARYSCERCRLRATCPLFRSCPHQYRGRPHSDHRTLTKHPSALCPQRRPVVDLSSTESQPILHRRVGNQRPTRPTSVLPAPRRLIPTCPRCHSPYGRRSRTHASHASSVSRVQCVCLFYLWFRLVVGSRLVNAVTDRTPSLKTPSFS